MRIQKILAAIAAVGFVSSSAVASVLPAPASNLTVSPAMAGARIGSTTTAKRSNLAGGGAGLAIVGVAAVGIGVAVAAAAGAFKDDDHRPAVSP